MTRNARSERLRLAVVGGRRGQAFGSALAALSDRLHLTAVCDVAEATLAAWAEQHPGVRAYRDYRELLADDAVDAVFLATPLKLHAQQAIAALAAGKHVLSEVVACCTLDEAWALVKAAERSGSIYMLAENYCYMRPNLMVRNMAESGALGRLTYLEGAYLHDCRQLLHDADGSLAWRGVLRTEVSSIYYPTHSLGPLAQWLKAANGAGDRLETVTAFTTPAAAVPAYYASTFGAGHPGASPDYWAQGDSGTVMITTTSGALIHVRVDAVSPRPHNMTHYVAQGTTGAYVSSRRDEEEPLVWIEGRSHETPHERGPHRAWDSLWDYTDDYEDSRWRSQLDSADQFGHGGGDYFVLSEFVDAALNGTRPEIDVYDAVTWSSIIPLSVQSIESGHRPVQIPDFAAGRS